MNTNPGSAKTGPQSGGSSERVRLSRRNFMKAGGAAAAAFSLVPRHVLGGPGHIAPSEKLTLAHIGCGTQALREMPGLLSTPEIQIVAVCDPVKEGRDYLDWSKDGLRSEIASALGRPDWRRGEPGIPGGREVAKEVIELAYAREKGRETFKGCTAYADFRELLEKEPDVNSVKVMTPDHLHATVAIAAMKRGKHVMMHKPLANRLKESRLVIETARQTKVATHFLPASEGLDIQTARDWIQDGAIGTLREIHNWSNRPVWPQYPTIPTDPPPVPDGFDWQLWLGPSLDRPYHPHYTHAVFRGWYEFGGGALADMGHYSLWPVFRLFELDSPIAVESRPSHLCGLQGNVPFRIKNDYSFPAACTIRFQFAAKGSRSPVELFWYDGSMKPPTPEELKNNELAPEGMLFLGDKGKILAGFRGEEPQLLPEAKMREYQAKKHASSNAPRGQARREANALWVAACKGGPATYGDFLLAQPISDAFNLGAVSLRLGGKRLLFDSTQASVTNAPEANKLLTREYRPGWELKG
jgi:hypothetical protein